MATSPTAAELIAHYQLAPHPEGGCYRESYRSGETIPREGLPARFPGPRSVSTAILFLLRAGERSALHRIRADELWHFHLGAPLLVHELLPGGRHRQRRLGPAFAAGEELQLVVPTGVWSGAELAPGAPPDAFALVGCTVAPGFDFADFELATAAELRSGWPEADALIRRLT